MNKSSSNLCIALLIGIITILIYILVFAVCGYYPFGNYTPITWDLDGQYLPFMSFYTTWYKNSFSDALYTQSIPLGSGTVGLWAYYLSSPFNLILFFLDLNTLPLAVTVIILLKHAFSAIMIYFYFTVRYAKNEKKELKCRIELFWGLFSVIYALSGYAVNMQFNIMWLDGMIILPMLCIALEWLVKRNKSLFFVISLCIALIANFYIGYMLWIFSFFYFLFLRIESGKKELRFLHWKIYIRSMCISAGLCAVLILPLIYSLSISKLSGNSIIEKIIKIVHENGIALGGIAILFLVGAILIFVYGKKIYSSINRTIIWGWNKAKKQIVLYKMGGILILIIALVGVIRGIIVLSNRGIIEKTLFYIPLKLFMGAFNSQEIVKGLPNIYVSSIIVLLVVVFIFDLHISVREKILHCSLAGIVFASMMVKRINYVWHGFSYPNGSNYRYSFMLSFVLIMIASYYIYNSLYYSENVAGIRKISISRMVVSKQKIAYAIGSAFVFDWLFLSIYKYNSLENDFLNNREIAVTVLFYLIVLICYILYDKSLILIMVTCAELVLNAVWCLETMTYVEWDAYQQEVQEISDIVSYIKANDKGIYRIEIPDIGANGALMYGYDSISHYSSVMPSKTATFLGRFGLTPEYMGNLETMYTISLNSDIAGLLNIKYVVSKDIIEKEGYIQMGSLHGYRIYKNVNYQTRGIMIDYKNINSDNKELCLGKLKEEAEPVELIIRNNQIVCKAQNVLEENKMLLLSVAYDKGWSAMIDGKRGNVEEAYDGLLCVQVPGGEHEIILSYQTPYLREGAFISGLAVLLCGGLLLNRTYKKRVGRGENL